MNANLSHGSLMKSAPDLIAITGGSGSGKTWLANQLRQRLGKETSRISLDDFYLDRSHLPFSRRSRVNFDHPRSIDWALVEQSLADCAAGRKFSLPNYDFNTHCRLPKTEVFHPKALVLVDGLWLLRRPALRQLFALKIFVNCPDPIRLERRLRRDAAERGRSATSIHDQFEKTVLPMHARFVEPQKRWADVVFNNDSSTDQLNDLLKQIHALMGGAGLQSNSPRSTS